MVINSSLLDPAQIIKGAYDEANQAHRVEPISGSLVSVAYDYIALTYVPSGNGAGQVQTVTYKTGGASGTTVAVLTLVYDASSNLSTVTKS